LFVNAENAADAILQPMVTVNVVDLQTVGKFVKQTFRFIVHGVAL